MRLPRSPTSTHKGHTRPLIIGRNQRPIMYLRTSYNNNYVKLASPGQVIGRDGVQTGWGRVGVTVREAQ